jgi:hypothetical protein
MFFINCACLSINKEKTMITKDLKEEIGLYSVKWCKRFYAGDSMY